MSNQSKALKSGVWYTVSNVLLKGIGFLTTPIFTRLLTQAEFGEFNNFVSWINIMSIITTLIFGVTLLTAKYDYKDRLDQYILSIVALASISVAVWTVLLNCFPVQAEAFFGMNRVYINGMMLYIFGHMTIDIFLSREQYRYAYKSNAITSLGLSVGSSLLSVLLVVLMPDKLAGRSIGYVLPAFLVGTGVLIFFIKKGKRVDVSCWGYALRISLPYILHSLSMVILNSMDRIMIKRMCGAVDTGLYSLACNCSALITLLTTSLNSAFSPWMGDCMNKGDYASIRKIQGKYIGIFSYFAVAAMLITPEILAILGGAEYASAIYAMPPLVMGCICQFIYCFFVNAEQFSKKTVGMAIGSVAAALVNYVLNALLIPKFGYVAAAYTTMASYFLLMLIHMFLVWRIGMASIANYKMIFLFVAVLLAVTCSANLLFGHMWLRYLVIAVYLGAGALVLLKNKEAVRTLISGVLSKD